MIVLPNDERVRLARFVTYLRPRWDVPGVVDAIAKLEPSVTDAGELALLMIGWARRGDAELPHGVLTAERNAAPSKPGFVPRRPEDRPRCPDHGSDLHASNGDWLCCWQERIEGKSSRSERTVVSHGPPPEVKAQLDAMRPPNLQIDYRLRGRPSSEPTNQEARNG